MKLLNPTPPNILKALDIDVTKTKKKVIKYITLKSLARITLSLLGSYPQLLKHHLKPMCWVALWLHVMPLLRMLACMKIWCLMLCVLVLLCGHFCARINLFYWRLYVTLSLTFLMPGFIYCLLCFWFLIWWLTEQAAEKQKWHAKYSKKRFPNALGSSQCLLILTTGTS